MSPKPLSRVGLGALVSVAMGLASCSGPPRSSPPASAIAPSAGAPLHFAYQALDGRPISSESLINRVSVIGLLATYDVHSQAEARFLAMLERRHTPRINVVALILEAPENRPLV